MVENTVKPLVKVLDAHSYDHFVTGFQQHSTSRTSPFGKWAMEVHDPGVQLVQTSSQTRQNANPPKLVRRF